MSPRGVHVYQLKLAVHCWRVDILYKVGLENLTHKHSVMNASEQTLMQVCTQGSTPIFPTQAFIYWAFVVPLMQLSA